MRLGVVIGPERGKLEDACFEVPVTTLARNSRVRSIRNVSDDSVRLFGQVRGFASAQNASEAPKEQPRFFKSKVSSSQSSSPNGPNSFDFRLVDRHTGLLQRRARSRSAQDASNKNTRCPARRHRFAPSAPRDRFLSKLIEISSPVEPSLLDRGQVHFGV